MRRGGSKIPFLARMGDVAVRLWQSILETLSFIGGTFVSFLRVCAGKACFRRSDLLHIVQECSSEALPIVSLISFLVGLILAFVAAIQLKLFGAQIYVADLVGIAMLRAMGAIMTGIIMAGRTGASFATHLGTMQVNEEIDALRTTGISPIDYLVLPRMLVLSLMMPLLTLYADLMGILGGLFVAVTALDINFMEYYSETTKSIGLTNLWIGLFSGLVFGILVALSGCLGGMQCGRSASAQDHQCTARSHRFERKRDYGQPEGLFLSGRSGIHRRTGHPRPGRADAGCCQKDHAAGGKDIGINRREDIGEFCSDERCGANPG